MYLASMYFEVPKDLRVLGTTGWVFVYEFDDLSEREHKVN